jgi:hypothetical protein
MLTNQAEYERLQTLRNRRSLLDLQDGEIIELYRMEKRFSPTSYGEIVAVLSTFPPYLSDRPHLISPFIELFYQAGRAAFKGITGREALRELLTSKSQVDTDLAIAMQHHPAEFERCLAALPE